ncbi:ubiquitin carboxyl-terminal hydrolase 45 isoform X2 [Narcine bancroftii]|uniref:ubiquitin carboxyl-terminal hydrolase 45 isoform X2 n=1 Tax=Narcine bancroftii TaxID=1343680 RepID=UPI00383168BE
MRVKDPSSHGNGTMTKKNRRRKKPQDDDSSDEVLGSACQHTNIGVDLVQVKKAVAQNHWSVCAECARALKSHGEDSDVLPNIWMCLKCGYQGCGQSSQEQHSLKHFHTTHLEQHYIAVSLDSWTVWCYGCQEELIPYNKKILAPLMDFLQKHATKTYSGSSSKLMKVQDENSDDNETMRGKYTINNAAVPVKGLSNLGNTCFFNAVMQNMAQTHLLSDLMCEMKEKGTKLKICPPAELNLDPLMVILPGPGSLTSAVHLFLHSMKEAGKGPLVPRILFNQLCQRAPRFKGFQQQDSQELLHYLLDTMQIEETKRIQSAILKAFNSPTVKTADEETKQKVKAYGRAGVKMNFINQIFVGELISTIMCEECMHISTVKEPFIDLSLPIVEERQSYVNKERIKGIKKSTGDEEWRWQASAEQSNEYNEAESNRTRGCSNLVESNRLSQSEGSDKDGNQSDRSNVSDRSNDADTEASEPENLPKPVEPLSCSTDSSSGVTTVNHKLLNSNLIQFKHTDFNDSISIGIGKLNLGSMKKENLIIDSVYEEQPDSISFSIQDTKEKSLISAFQTLSRSYRARPKECSLQSCLAQFTAIDLLMGNNKLLCEKCTERKQKQHKKAQSAEKKSEHVYTNARKQMLISAVPPILNLHLKRFHQAGLSLRKVNKHVDFPLVLDMAPFCSSNCKNVGDENKVLYGLYGIVEHCGSMRGGHYAAYVQVRTANKKMSEYTPVSKHIPGSQPEVSAFPLRSAC